jgi:hypothetical protein
MLIKVEARAAKALLQKHFRLSATLELRSGLYPHPALRAHPLPEGEGRG